MTMIALARGSINKLGNERY